MNPRRKPDATRIKSRRKPKHTHPGRNLIVSGRTVAKQRGIMAYFTADNGPMGSQHASLTPPVIGQDLDEV